MCQRLLPPPRPAPGSKTVPSACKIAEKALSVTQPPRRRAENDEVTKFSFQLRRLFVVGAIIRCQRPDTAGDPVLEVAECQAGEAVGVVLQHEKGENAVRPILLRRLSLAACRDQDVILRSWQQAARRSRGRGRDRLQLGNRGDEVCVVPRSQVIFPSHARRTFGSRPDPGPPISRVPDAEWQQSRITVTNAPVFVISLISQPSSLSRM